MHLHRKNKKIYSIHLQNYENNLYSTFYYQTGMLSTQAISNLK
jgi:hypothetical protein